MHYSNDLNCLYLVSTYVAVIRFDVLIINGPKKYYCYDIFRILRLLSKFKVACTYHRYVHCTYSQNVESRMRIAKYEVLLQRPKKILDDFEIFFQNYVLQFIIQKIL